MRRISTHLEKLGANVQIVTTQPLTEESLLRAMTFRPEIVHAFHALKAGVVALEIAKKLSVPLVVTITGTDVHSDLHHPERREIVLRVLRSANAITTFAPAIADELAAVDISLAAKTHIIPQGVWFPPQENWDVRKHLGISAFVPLLLLPANIRKVKRPMLAFEGVGLLRKRGFDAHILFVGEILEAEEWERLKAAIEKCQWAHYLGSVPMERMVSVYLAAGIVLNTSEHEGGMANALLEAMWLRRPVLASAVAGNLSLVRHEETGLLFSDAGELAKQAEKLLADANLSERLVQNAYDWVHRNCDPIKEAQSYLEVYSGFVGQIHERVM
ncbi:MAG: glycosyltransferase family 4 protein [Armatimonadetes bacterium]|nr:glycosyltransferase family 4 protein [Armatimonadota bacterium]